LDPVHELEVAAMKDLPFLRLRYFLAEHPWVEILLLGLFAVVLLSASLLLFWFAAR